MPRCVLARLKRAGLVVGAHVTPTRRLAAASVSIRVTPSTSTNIRSWCAEVPCGFRASGPSRRCRCACRCVTRDRGRTRGPRRVVGRRGAVHEACTATPQAPGQLDRGAMAGLDQHVTQNGCTLDRHQRCRGGRGGRRRGPQPRPRVPTRMDPASGLAAVDPGSFRLRYRETTTHQRLAQIRNEVPPDFPFLAFDADPHLVRERFKPNYLLARGGRRAISLTSTKVQLTAIFYYANLVV